MYLSRALLFSSLLFPVLAASQPQHEKRNSPVTFPIKRKAFAPSKNVDVRDVAKANLSRRHGRRTGGHFDKRGTSETFAISDFDGDEFYYTTIQIGTPPQNIDVVLDTSSS